MQEPEHTRHLDSPGTGHRGETRDTRSKATKENTNLYTAYIYKTLATTSREREKTSEIARDPIERKYSPSERQSKRIRTHEHPHVRER